ncbi:MAG: hypothetical protein ACK56F_07670, partial [bacterium]
MAADSSSAAGPPLQWLLRILTGHGHLGRVRHVSSPRRQTSLRRACSLSAMIPKLFRPLVTARSCLWCRENPT